MIAHDFKGDIEDINRAVSIYIFQKKIMMEYGPHDLLFLYVV